MPANTLSEDFGIHLFKVLERFTENIKEGNFAPCIVFQDDAPVEFSAVPLSCYAEHPAESQEIKQYDSISSVLEDYYAKKNQITRIRQKSADLRRIVTTAIERESKKYDLQTKQLMDTEKRENYKVYGELITAYGYGIEPGSKSMQALNYYTNEMVTIPLDPTLTATENAKNFFDKYNKCIRRTSGIQSRCGRADRSSGNRI